MHLTTVKAKGLNIDIPITALSFINFFKQNNNETNWVCAFLFASEEIQCLFMSQTASRAEILPYWDRRISFILNQ